jgi:hypothetical protein
MLVEKFFVQPDPAAARLSMIWAPSGNKWEQEYIASESAAAAFSHFDTFAASAFTTAAYDAFLSGIAKMDQRNRGVSALGEGPNQGRQDRLTKKRMIIKGLSELWRQYLYTGEPVTAGVGGNLAAVIGANAVIELGPRLTSFGAVHQIGATTSTSEGLIRWVLAAKTLEYQAPGDTQYGPPVVVDSANNYRLTLWSGGTVAGSKNEPAWIRVSIAAAELAALRASGNFTPTPGTALDVLTFTPTKQMTGLLRQITPMQQIYHDLSGLPPVSGVSVDTNGPAAGGSLNREGLTWMVQRLLDASNENPSQCAIFMPDNLLIRAEGIITQLGHGSETSRFLGADLDALFYRRIAFLRNKYLPTDLVSRDGTRTDLTMAMGVCFGDSDEGGAHVKYRTLSNDVINEVFADGSFDMTKAPGDGTPQGATIPVSYWEEPYASTSLDVNQIGHMMGEPVAHIQDLCAVVNLFNG